MSRGRGEENGATIRAVTGDHTQPAVSGPTLGPGWGQVWLQERNSHVPCNFNNNSTTLHCNLCSAENPREMTVAILDSVAVLNCLH